MEEEAYMPNSSIVPNDEIRTGLPPINGDASDGGAPMNGMYVTLIVSVAALGGLLFGYDQGVISGAIGLLVTRFGLGTGVEGFITGSFALGAMAGCLIAGYSADRLGRKPLLFVAAGLFMFGGVGAGLSSGPTWIIVFRTIGGLAVGIASTLVPLYIAEVAPARIRGRAVGSFQLSIVTGTLIVYIVNAAVANTHTQAWDLASGWRWMFAAAVVPGFIFFATLLLIPESPRFMVIHGKRAEAKRVLTRISGGVSEVAESQIGEIEATLALEQQGFWRELFRKGFRTALLVAGLMAIFQQLTGANAISYYSPIIFRAAGASASASLDETIGVGIFKVVFVIVFMLVVDRLGRRRLLKWGGFGMAACMLALAAAFWTAPLSRTIDFVILLLVFSHVIFYEVSWSGGTWTVISEIFPNKIRARAASICSCVVWFGSYLISQFFPMMLKSWGASATFFTFACFCVIMSLFIMKFLPEMKRMSLEHIETGWIDKGSTPVHSDV